MIRNFNLFFAIFSSQEYRKFDSHHWKNKTVAIIVAVSRLLITTPDQLINYKSDKCYRRRPSQMIAMMLVTFRMIRWWCVVCVLTIFDIIFLVLDALCITLNFGLYIYCFFFRSYYFRFILIYCEWNFIDKPNRTSFTIVIVHCNAAVFVIERFKKIFSVRENKKWNNDGGAALISYCGCS